ncbi:hypothetical protein PL75_06300 [Neisseria arctica]|uniref:Zinc metalloprotease zmpB n=1 Tax=Neisseria arctica TaxID=1470200 RepID=A0A0J0YS22_9NEIS|nr:hypothetical protein [Neisseria arctica]KLT72902.1 hypothetical protein PL75_06300 [Neisseria arctica]UOO86617.1 hypothetical protein LVJ86_10595 [Neisseria arctica]
MSDQKQTAAKQSFRLTPKHLLLAAFILVSLLVLALVIGVARTMQTPDQPSTQNPTANSNTVEILSPRGAQDSVPGTVAPASTNQNTAPVEQATNDSTESATETSQPQPTAVAPQPRNSGTKQHPKHREQTAATPAEIPVLPKNVTPEPLPKVEPKPQPQNQAVEKPAPRPQTPAKPKDVMDNLF